MAEGLPKLPGLDFENRYKSDYRVSHSFNVVNGYPIPKSPIPGIGDGPSPEESIAFPRPDDTAMYDPILTYGRLRKTNLKPFVPRYVLYDKKALTFKAFFKQSVPESPLEHFRVRFVNIIYFLEDDSLTVMEPEVVNSGIPQGRLIRRGKVPKNTNGDYYSWKDFNVGIDVEMNGIAFHITDCDSYTREFLISQGVELNCVETPPTDPVTTQRTIDKINRMNKTPSDDDKLRRFLEFQGKILKFDCILDETDREGGECMTYQLFYFLQDDTISIKELPENQEGRDHFPMLLRKTKLPKNWKAKPVNFPSIYLEVSDNEVIEYYQPKDLRIGETIFVYGRRFLLLDCDQFTRKYFSDVLKNPQGSKLCVKFPPERKSRRVIPEYLGLGTPEDSMASCYGLTPKPPKKDIVKYLLNTNKFLRYGCVLDSAHPEDDIRKFVLSYSLADDKILIHEPPIKNSGILGGKFLASQRVKVPGCNPNMPVYYGPKDFSMGAILRINDHRFKIVSADLFVYEFMKQNQELFAYDALEGVRNYLLMEGKLQKEVKTAMDRVNAEPESDAEKEKRVAVPNVKTMMAESEPETADNCIKTVDITDEQAITTEGEEPVSTVASRDPKTCFCPYEIKPAIEECVAQPCPKTERSDYSILRDYGNGNGNDGKRNAQVRFSDAN